MLQARCTVEPSNSTAARGSYFHVLSFVPGNILHLKIYFRILSFPYPIDYCIQTPHMTDSLPYLHEKVKFVWTFSAVSRLSARLFCPPTCKQRAFVHTRDVTADRLIQKCLYLTHMLHNFLMIDEE